MLDAVGRGAPPEHAVPQLFYHALPCIYGAYTVHLPCIYPAQHSMGFQEFCDALLEMASRKSAREGDGVGSVAPRLVELLESLPEETITLSEQSDAPAATLRKAATAASCVAKVRRATHDGNRLSPPP